MDAAGLSPEDFAGEFVDVWPENWPNFILFSELKTQWRGEWKGLDYNVLYRRFDRMGLTPDQCDELEADIRVMESAAIASMNKIDD